MSHRRGHSGSSGFFNPFPRYLQIRQILTRRLSEGFTVGQRFPTEQELCTEFDVSRETIREALLGLERDGYIERRRGSGTVVVQLPERTRDERLTGLVEDYTELKLDTDVDVIRAEPYVAQGRVSAALGLKRNQKLFRILRLRRVEGKPFACHDAFLPHDIGREIAALDLAHTTLFRELSRTLDLPLLEIYQHIEASSTDPAMARLLDVNVGAPLLVTRRALSHNGGKTPTMLFETFFRSDRYYYTVQLDNRSGSRGSDLAARTDAAVKPSISRNIPRTK